MEVVLFNTKFVVGYLAHIQKLAGLTKIEAMPKTMDLTLTKVTIAYCEFSKHVVILAGINSFNHLLV